MKTQRKYLSSTCKTSIFLIIIRLRTYRESDWLRGKHPFILRENQFLTFSCFKALKYVESENVIYFSKKRFLMPTIFN